jgi:hypothetical protein
MAEHVRSVCEEARGKVSNIVDLPLAGPGLSEDSSARSLTARPANCQDHTMTVRILSSHGCSRHMVLSVSIGLVRTIHIPYRVFTID